MSSGTISDANPLGLDGCDREIQPHEYSVVCRAPLEDLVLVGGAAVRGQGTALLARQTKSVDTCICQRCHATIHLPPPRKLMGRWEEALGRCFYWWTQRDVLRLCAKCQDRADTIGALFGDESGRSQRGFIRLLGEWNAKTGHRAQLVHCWPGTVLLSCEPETAKAELSTYVESILPLGICHEYEGAHPYRKEATS